MYPGLPIRDGDDARGISTPPSCVSRHTCDLNSVDGVSYGTVAPVFAWGGDAMHGMGVHL